MSTPTNPLSGRRVALALAGATVIFTSAFRGRRRFWEKMAIGGGTLGTVAVLSNPDLRRTRISGRDVATGLISAAMLYGIFQAGDRFARRVMPHGAADIDDIYARRGLAPTPMIGLALALVIAPGEELFWRGLVNRYLAQRIGPVAGNATGAAIYGGVHLVSGNLTLTGAAAVAGAFWSLQHLLDGSMGALIVSHVAWDVWIFLVRPTR